METPSELKKYWNNILKKHPRLKPIITILVIIIVVLPLSILIIPKAKHDKNKIINADTVKNENYKNAKIENKNSPNSNNNIGNNNSINK